MLGTSQISGFQPCHILKGWSWARDLPVLPHLLLPGMGRGGAASPTHGQRDCIYPGHKHRLVRAPQRSHSPPSCILRNLKRPLSTWRREHRPTGNLLQVTGEKKKWQPQILMRWEYCLILWAKARLPDQWASCLCFTRQVTRKTELRPVSDITRRKISAH